MTRLLPFGVLLLLLSGAGAAAADVTVRASIDPPRIAVGDRAVLAVAVDGAQDAPAPSIEGTGGLTVRYVGPSTEVRVENGRVAASVTHSFSITAANAGTFTLGPITLAYAGKQLSAGTVTLVVLPPGAGGTAAATDRLKLALSLDKTEAYLYERVPVTVRLSVGAVRVTNVQYPTVAGDGFAVEQFPKPVQRREQTPAGAVDVIELRTMLTPLRSGTLAVGPAAMSLSLLERGRRNDPFFGSLFGETERGVDLHSEPATLTVLPLPEADRPADFSGAVGRFDLDVRVAPLALAAGDPVTVTSTIRGEGWLEGIAAPPIVPGDGLRVYPAQPVTTPPGQAAGTKIFEQVVIPQRAGTVVLPELRFSYFDPTLRAYRTATHAATTLAVQPSAHAEAEPRIVGTERPREKPETLGHDLVFIKDAPGALRAIGARRRRSPWFWLWQAVPVAVWLGAGAVDRRRRRLSGDVRYARFTRAGRAARAAIAGARTALRAGDRAAFYDTLARAVSQYLSAKLDLPPGSITPDVVGGRLRAHGLPAAVSQDVEALFAACERARFAPDLDASGDMERTLERADAIVRALERERRLGRSLAAASLLLLLAHAGRLLAATETPNTLFFQGNTLYGQERYAEAADTFERVLASGWESGNLYFNLGNAYLKSGDVGRAVLDYERALRFIPGDPDLQANLGFARSLAADVDETPIGVRFLLPLAGRLDTDTLLVAASACWTALLLFLALARLVPTLARAVPAAVALGAVALVLLVPPATHRLLTIDGGGNAVVVAHEEAAVRFEPSTTGTVHFQAKPGSVVRVLGEREGWAQVARRDGRRGWIPRAAIATL